MKPSQNRFSPFIKKGEQQQPFPIFPTRFEKKKLEEKRRKDKKKKKKRTRRR